MMVRISAKLEVLVGILTLLTGLLYLFRVFGPTESEVITWGLLAVILGGVFVLLSTTKFPNFMKMIVACLLVVIQIPAIILWVSFHGSGISDGTPKSNFVAHWIFAFPHMMIVVLGILLVFSLIDRKTEKSLN
ncbi:hypothetical protein ACFOZY_14385 [Chungangia koreensis]|uniref:Uncharacterized protein n=1 Tax=Chungangia koreensis TaxID=752657 RepID=A0ABV8XAH3_9LACT